MALSIYFIKEQISTDRQIWHRLVQFVVWIFMALTLVIKKKLEF